MSLISFTALQDGVTSVNAAATNTPLSTIYNDYNGNITDANIASAAAINASKLAGGISGMFGAFTSWSPTLSGRFTDAKWNKTGSYIQIGKIVFFQLRLVANTTTPMGGSGDATIPLPVTALAFTTGDLSTRVTGTGGILQSGVTGFSVSLSLSDANTIAVRSSIATGITNTAPFTWTTNSEIFIQGFYQAA